jgi:hypothetical protein
LLISLLLLLVVLPFFEAPLLADILFSLVLLLGVYANIPSRRVFAVCLLLAGLSVAVGGAQYFIDAKVLRLIGSGLDIAFLTITGGIILTAVLQARRVTVETVAGGICVYLLIGILWALVFTLLLIASPGSFAGGGLSIQEGAPIFSHRAQLQSLLYYSFVTLTTLGYGDITPMTPPARSLAALEAVIGQLYIAVLIARLVGLSIAHSGQEGSE